MVCVSNPKLLRDLDVIAKVTLICSATQIECAIRLGRPTAVGIHAGTHSAASDGDADTRDYESVVHR